MFSFVHYQLYIVTSVFRIVMGCACQLVIKEMMMMMMMMMMNLYMVSVFVIFLL